MNIASESDGFNESKRSEASPDPSSIIINNKKQQHSTTTTIILTDLSTHRDVSLTALDYSPLLWGIFLKNITIGFPHSPKPSPMTSGHHTSWNSDMKDNHSLVSRETETERERENEREKERNQGFQSWS